MTCQPPILSKRMQKAPDFFLGSSEHRGKWATVRACWLSSVLLMEDGTECALIKIAPPIIGQPYGLGGGDIYDLILASRYKKRIFSTKREPLERVHIFRVLNKSNFADKIVINSDIELTAWGEIYPTLKDAEQATS